MIQPAETTVLVVDDEEDLADLYTEFLESEGYTVRTAYGGGKAILELDDNVDVVLLDRQMPGMRGEEVLAEIRDWMDWCRVVMVTGEEPGFEVAGIPFDEYLTKPVDKELLTATVQQMVLLDRYDTLLNEYLSVTKRYATLKSHKDDADLEGNEQFAALEERRRDLRSQLREVVGSFTDPEFAEAFEELHVLEQE
jgi:DNA-binding response OmpR family regulator